MMTLTKYEFNSREVNDYTYTEDKKAGRYTKANNRVSPKRTSAEGLAKTAMLSAALLASSNVYCANANQITPKVVYNDIKQRNNFSLDIELKNYIRGMTEAKKVENSPRDVAMIPAEELDIYGAELITQKVLGTKYKRNTEFIEMEMEFVPKRNLLKPDLSNLLKNSPV